MRRLVALLAVLVLGTGPAHALDDVDEDGIEPPKDKCPTVAEPDRTNGCPLYKRELTRAYAPADRLWLGQLIAPSKGLRAGQKVYIYQVRPGKDLLVATAVTKKDGSYRATFGTYKANYYAKANMVIDPTTGQAKKVFSDILVIQGIS